MVKFPEHQSTSPQTTISKALVVTWKRSHMNDGCNHRCAVNELREKEAEAIRLAAEDTSNWTSSPLDIRDRNLCT